MYTRTIQNGACDFKREKAPDALDGDTIDMPSTLETQLAVTDKHRSRCRMSLTSKVACTNAGTAVVRSVRTSIVYYDQIVPDLNEYRHIRVELKEKLVRTFHPQPIPGGTLATYLVPHCYSVGEPANLRVAPRNITRPRLQYVLVHSSIIS